jgi:hypothetical protein
LPFRATKIIFVRGHRILELREIAKVIGIAHGADIFQVSLMTE